MASLNDIAKQLAGYDPQALSVPMAQQFIAELVHRMPDATASLRNAATRQTGNAASTARATSVGEIFERQRARLPSQEFRPVWLQRQSRRRT